MFINLFYFFIIIKKLWTTLNKLENIEFWMPPKKCILELVLKNWNPHIILVLLLWFAIFYILWIAFHCTKDNCEKQFNKTIIFKQTQRQISLMKILKWWQNGKYDLYLGCVRFRVKKFGRWVQNPPPPFISFSNFLYKLINLIEMIIHGFLQS
jgi:hypothetical protein